MATMAVTAFDIPGDSGFPLNSFMNKPSNRGESGECVCICVMHIYMWRGQGPFPNICLHRPDAPVFYSDEARDGVETSGQSFRL